MKKVLIRLGIALLLITPFGFPSKASTEDSPCFLTTESGRVINLNTLCGKPRKPMKKITTDLDPKYVTTTPEGGFWVEPGADTSFRLPTGHVIDPDGTVNNPDGTKYKPVLKDGKYIGTQFFRPDGTPAEPGEILKFPNGQSVQQASF